MAELFNDLFEEAAVTPMPPSTPNDDAFSQKHYSETQESKNHYIFCSECGKKIKLASKFCKYCGTKVDDEFSSSNSIPSMHTPVQKVDALTEPILEHTISTAKPIEVKIKSDSTIKKSTIADEIIANLKMIVLALIIWVVYIIGFICYRSRDAAPLTETDSYYGESCYDSGCMTGNWEFSWEKHLVSKLYYISNKLNKYGISEFNPLSVSDYLYISNLTPSQALEEAKRQAKAKNISDEYLAQLTQEAKNEAKHDIDSFNDEISRMRKNSYEDELRAHVLWAAVISLFVMIFGRYFILACKWLSRNKSE